MTGGPEARWDGEGPAVELRGVDFSFGRTVVLEDVDLTVRRGEFLGVLGPNGAGKTTLLRILLGLLEPDAGEVRVLGTTPREARGRVGYVPQFARFDREMPVRVEDVVLMGRLHARRFGPRWRAEDREAARRAMAVVELGDLAERPVGSLSGGQLQRSLIARALAMEPELLLLDEPTASVDTPVGRELYRTLSELTDRMTVILVTHDVGVLSREVESVACLNRRLYYHGDEELTPELLEKTYGREVDLVSHASGHRPLGGHGGG